MLSELVYLFRADPQAEVGERLALMLKRTQDMVAVAGQVLFGEEPARSHRDELYAWDHDVNQLEQEIRRWVLVHLAFPGVHPDLARSLVLISLVKDVERLGDYAKNLAEIVDIRSSPFPEGRLLAELMEIRYHVETVHGACLGVFTDSQPDSEKVADIIQEARPTVRRCDALIRAVGRSSHDAATATAFTLAARYYKRICAHVLNVLSSIVMPLDKVDYHESQVHTSAHSSVPR